MTEAVLVLGWQGGAGVPRPVVFVAFRSNPVWGDRIILDAFRLSVIVTGRSYSGKGSRGELFVEQGGSSAVVSHKSDFWQFPRLAE